MKTTNILFSLLAITATANAAIPVRMAKSADSRMLHDETHTTFSKGKLDTKAFTNDNGELQAGFTILGAESGQQTLWSENFDDGSDGWTLNNAENFSWEL